MQMLSAMLANEYNIVKFLEFFSILKRPFIFVGACLNQQMSALSRYLMQGN